MQAGMLRNRVWIEVATRTLDAVGQPATTWARATNGNVFAAIQPLRGVERFTAQQLSAKMSHKITIRYWSGLTPDEHRIKWGTRIFDINGVINIDERNKRMELYCTEAL